MAYFDRDPDFLVKMTKCRPDVHARWAQIPPRHHAASCPCDAAPHLLRAGVELTLFPDILNEVVSIRKLGTFGVADANRHVVVHGSLNSVKQVLNSVNQRSNRY